MMNCVKDRDIVMVKIKGDRELIFWLKRWFCLKKYLDHALVGYYVGYRECHLTPDWFIYVVFVLIKGLRRFDGKQSKPAGCLLNIKSYLLYR